MFPTDVLTFKKARQTAFNEVSHHRPTKFNYMTENKQLFDFRTLAVN